MLMALRGWNRAVAFTGLALVTIYTILLYGRPAWLPAPPKPFGDGSASGRADVSNSANRYNNTFLSGPDHFATDTTSRTHPIDRLIEDARASFAALLAKRSYTVADAAARYRERRGRHPPPGFDTWFKTAMKQDAVIVEEFFDRIHDDLAPFWALKPADMRRQTNTQPQVIRVRKGRAIMVTDDLSRPPWIQHWTALVEEMAQYLPDLDMVVNVMDETRLLVPWEKINGYVAVERLTRYIPPPFNTTRKYSGLADVDGIAEPYKHSWVTNDANRFWNHLAATCHPDSPTRAMGVAALDTFDKPIEYPTTPNAAYTVDGFVANATASRDPCLQPYLRGMHGTFIESVSMSTSHDLLPMFAGCKLPQNNEILIPGAMYLTEDPFYSGGEKNLEVAAQWADKRPGLIWRGTASGGRSKADNWWHFHRHRWVQMTNGTTVAAMEHNQTKEGPTFNLRDVHGLVQQKEKSLGEWVSSFSDVGFVDLECFPMASDEEGNKELTCDYTSPHMEVKAGVPMAEQYNYKFLPDVDGNSYSARWRSFLRSTSMPLKATIYAEWHDDRLMPWVHYVPFDSSYMDFYAVMDYFLDSGRTTAGHDAVAARIADESRVWAESVLRREDMRLYVWRLLLEYARVVDDERYRLGYVADLEYWQNTMGSGVVMVAAVAGCCAAVWQALVRLRVISKMQSWRG